MRMILWIIVTSMLTISATSTSTGFDEFKGQWYSQDMDRTTLNIYKAQNGYWYGKIIASDAEESVGKFMLIRLTPDVENNSLVGTIKKPSNSIEAAVTLVLKDRNKLKTTAKKFFMSRTFELSRIE